MNEEFYIEKTTKKVIQELREKFEGTREEFDKSIEEKLPKILNQVINGLTEELLSYCFDKNNDLKKQEEKIEKSIRSKYGKGLEIFDAFIELNSKISAYTYEKYFKIFKTLEDHTKLDTLISIHVRACQIANEIKVLIRSGYADGAISRWRTMHELCITFLFLYDNDNETIQMYNDYQAIENWRKVKEYQEHYKTFGWEPFDKEDLESLENDRNEMIAKYGKEFGKGYGWTLKILPAGRRNIREIEKKVGQEHFRPIYTWASENVHSGVSGIKRKLGLRESEQDFLLTSCNDFGFTESIEFSTSTLLLMSKTLLNMEDSIMNGIMIKLLYSLQDDVITEFSEIENSYT